MATAEQLKSLVRSHFSENPERFFTIALQVAAHEASQGHGAVAHDIRDIIDKSKRMQGARVLKFPGDLQGLVLSDEPQTPLSALVLPSPIEQRIERVLHEYRQPFVLDLAIYHQM